MRWWWCWSIESVSTEASNAIEQIREREKARKQMFNRIFFLTYKSMHMRFLSITKRKSLKQHAEGGWMSNAIIEKWKSHFVAMCTWDWWKASYNQKGEERENLYHRVHHHECKRVYLDSFHSMSFSYSICK